MQVKIDKWKRFPLLPCQYLNKWIFAVPITVNSMESFLLINTVSERKMNNRSVHCSLWYPAEEPYSLVDIGHINLDEWESYINECNPPHLDQKVCSASMKLDAIRDLDVHVSQMDWEKLTPLSINCLAVFSQFLEAAIQQGAGLKLEIR